MGWPNAGQYFALQLIGLICLSEFAPRVFIFCALACEAKPLIHAWQLKKLPTSEHPFAIYTGGQSVIVISGIGKIAMAGAIGYTMALFANPRMPLILNLGIAGHQNYALGSLILGQKIVDSETYRCFYPQLPFKVSIPANTVITQVRPNTKYSAQGVFDMEASAFYEMAVKFSSSELIHVLKIISDNTCSPVTDISETLVEQWITRQLPVIDNLIETVSEQDRLLESNDSGIYTQVLKDFRFTVSGCLKLKALLLRWQVLNTDDAPLVWQKCKLKSGKEFLQWLEKQLDEAGFSL